MSETFPISSSGNRWKGSSDKQGVIGNSYGSLSRENYNSQFANVLRGEVFEDGFAQAFINLPLKGEPGSSVDGSRYAGISIDLCSSVEETYELVIKNGDCLRDNSR